MTNRAPTVRNYAGTWSPIGTSVGAAKGQAPALTWMCHLVRHFLRRAYAQVTFDESWLCPSPTCHGLEAACSRRGAPPSWRLTALGGYRGSEFALEPPKWNAKAKDHVCEQEGCWHQLGTGHKLQPIKLREEEPTCASCARPAQFALRAGGGFGWASKEDAQAMRRGMAVAQPQLGLRV